MKNITEIQRENLFRVMMSYCRAIHIKSRQAGVFTVVYILLGVVIGAALIWFLIVPAKLQSSQHENNDTIKNTVSSFRDTR